MCCYALQTTCVAHGSWPGKVSLYSPFLPLMEEKGAKEDQGPTGAGEFSGGGPGKLGGVPNAYLRSLTKFNRSAFITTQKLERLMAAAPNMGVMPTPNTGIHRPAANGMPTTL